MRLYTKHLLFLQNMYYFSKYQIMPKELNIQLTYPEETKIEEDTCIQLFIAALFTIARTWKQPRCPSTDEWIKKLWYVYIPRWNIIQPQKGVHLSQF